MFQTRQEPPVPFYVFSFFPSSLLLPLPKESLKSWTGGMCSLSRREGLPAEAPGQSRVIKSKSCESPKTVCDGCACVSQECFTRHTRPLQLEFGAPQKNRLRLFIIPLLFFHLNL